MLDRIAEGEAEGILAWHPDRLARNMTDGAKLVELIESVGASLVFPTYHFDNTPHGIFCLSLFTFKPCQQDSTQTQKGL